MFVAYGNAVTQGSLESGFSITCQHGERECTGNIVQACTVNHVPDMWSQIYLLNCMASDSSPDKAGPGCFSQLGLDYSSVQTCAEGEEGQRLHFSQWRGA
eukprot:TRINITY_DN6227_c0_g1_i1.p1 TRINITY_DN6227_c0_g1~~TRINITY_DN6227_c0_g1_i1.p1  ORF type:complete len:100 (+),score=30.25 TRINITY_DN6227_c0_g1_i1:209-508(+)